MGQYNANNDNQIVQELVGALPNGDAEVGNFSAPVYFNGYVYFAAVNDSLKAFQLSNGLLSTGPTSQSSAIYPFVEEPSQFPQTATLTEYWGNTKQRRI